MKRLAKFFARLYPAAFLALLEDVTPGWRTSLDVLNQPTHDDEKPPISHRR
jgi:hypothetical protein